MYMLEDTLQLLQFSNLALLHTCPVDTDRVFYNLLELGMGFSIREWECILN
jgi:hypothetical protein